MRNLIDRDELYKALAQWDWQDLYLPVHFKELVDGLPVVRHSYEDGIRKGYEDAVLHYAKLALKQWIPVSERLPEDVLCGTLVTDGMNVWVETWIGIVGQWKYNHSVIIAWMPLPEPYKEGEQ